MGKESITNKEFIHKRTGNHYRVVTDNLMVKEDGEWIKGFVLYETLYNNPDGRYFVRTRDDFDNNFVQYSKNNK